MSPLLALPVELLNRIITFIDKPKSLASANQTCRLLQELTESPLYESVLIINNKASSFGTAILKNPERKALVKEVTVDCNIKKNASEKDRSACTQAPLFAEFSNLEVLSLSSGYWHWDDGESDGESDGDNRVAWATDQDNLGELFEQAGLSKPIEGRIWTKLRSCTLDFWERNGQGWYCTFEPAIFLVAALEDLILRGCRFTDRDGEKMPNSPHCGQTALRKLTLERCYIHHTAVFNFLSAPKALKHLTLGHDQMLWHHEMGDQPTTSDRAEDYMTAFNHQKHSLQYLYLGHELCPEIQEGEFDFSAFPKLEDVDFDREFWIWDDDKQCLQQRELEWFPYESPGG